MNSAYAGIQLQGIHLQAINNYSTTSRTPNSTASKTTISFYVPKQQDPY